MLFVADRCWDVGGLGTLIFGIWLALNLDQYDFFDGWILLALFLWFVATGLGQSVQRRIGGDDIRSVIALHWIRTIVVIGLLVTMIWKPAHDRSSAPSAPTTGTSRCSCTSSARWRWWARSRSCSWRSPSATSGSATGRCCSACCRDGSSMRGGAEWIAEKEKVNDLDPVPSVGRRRLQRVRPDAPA